MQQSFCTECGDPVESRWKHCPSCGQAVESQNHQVRQRNIDLPGSSHVSLDEDKDEDEDEDEDEWTIRPHIDRRVAYQCATRWALLIGAIVWVLLALFLPVNATWSSPSKNALGVTQYTQRPISCPNGLESLTSSKKNLSVSELEACANPSKTTWILDGGLSALIWALLTLGIGYLINRNRLVRTDSLWFPYAHST